MSKSTIAFIALLWPDRRRRSLREGCVIFFARSYDTPNSLKNPTSYTIHICGLFKVFNIKLLLDITVYLTSSKPLMLHLFLMKHELHLVRQSRQIFIGL